ncbi:hypothetical protein [Actinoplanes cyaneus]|uniref:hypothetical protein n=1 Tax=Actinoplanes cyaneus TaxID=52696 RepID=UPI0019450B10|nr:hypothetical protein [Actinoplanes cyaneus]
MRAASAGRTIVTRLGSAAARTTSEVALDVRACTSRNVLPIWTSDAGTFGVRTAGRWVFRECPVTAASFEVAAFEGTDFTAATLGATDVKAPAFRPATFGVATFGTAAFEAVRFRMAGFGTDFPAAPAADLIEALAADLPDAPTADLPEAPAADLTDASEADLTVPATPATPCPTGRSSARAACSKRLMAR